MVVLTQRWKKKMDAGMCETVFYTDWDDSIGSFETFSMRDPWLTRNKIGWIKNNNGGTWTQNQNYHLAGSLAVGSVWVW